MNKQEALNHLRELLKPGDTVYCVLRHCSRSGMSRRISLLTADHHSLDWLCESAGLAKRRQDGEGLVVVGCGMDMGFHLVYNLGMKLWPDGTPEPHGRRNGAPDSCGGYALKHCWL